MLKTIALLNGSHYRVDSVFYDRQRLYLKGFGIAYLDKVELLKATGYRDFKGNEIYSNDLVIVTTSDGEAAHTQTAEVVYTSGGWKLLSVEDGCHLEVLPDSLVEDLANDIITIEVIHPIIIPIR